MDCWIPWLVSCCACCACCACPLDPPEVEICKVSKEFSSDLTLRYAPLGSHMRTSKMQRSHRTSPILGIWHIYGYLMISSGWWYTYPSEKYEFVSWDDFFPNWMESHKIPWFLFHQAVFNSVSFSLDPRHPGDEAWQAICHQRWQSRAQGDDLGAGNLRRKWRSLWNKNHELNNGKHGKHIGQSWKIISKQGTKWSINHL